MSMSECKQGDVLCGQGLPVQGLLLMIKGSAEASFNGRTFRFEKGDVLGLIDLDRGEHSLTYTASTDVTVFSYPFGGFEELEKLLNDNSDAANLMVNSMCRQMADFLQTRTALAEEAAGNYAEVRELYPQYEKMSKLYALTPKKIPGLPELTPFSGSDPIEAWLSEYYLGVNYLGASVRKSFFYGHAGISLGFLRQSASDFRKVLEACGAYYTYLSALSQVFLESGGHDLFSVIADLHLSSINIKGADEAVKELMARLTGLLSNMTGVDPGELQNRLNQYQEALHGKRSSQETVTEAPDVTHIRANLTDSLENILSYSGLPQDVCNKFTKYVHDYTELEDRGGGDDIARRIRKELTTIFYQIYQGVFIKSLEDTALPTVIKMFLNFGYVDAALAGYDNADYLYSIADSLRGDAENGVYTIREWLTAIYQGKKEPNRNEFDMDYNEYLREQKQQGKIDAKEEAKLAADPEGKLRFELENVFPIVNKITFGRITIFCPLFSDQNVQRKPESTLVTPALLKERIGEIRGTDYTAFYREILFTNVKCDIRNETIHIETLPDIILCPNIGVRGAMWQEIEGRKRDSAARWFVPLFLEGDLKNLIIRMTAEFRWEMCKRIQGMRWNDVTNPSLTSEFCDYLQFYRNNKELSQETKDDIKSDLVRAKNNYKNVFVLNYTEWLLYEANGSPRLNKVALGQMITYCPFPAAVRERLLLNPRYAQLLTRFNNKAQQTAQRLNNVIQKAHRMGQPTPPELEAEMDYVKG
ncbi:MAG: hypothetical protein FWG31_10030 [Oscillospiraceae bacterium]|nr:hypothetical protein [Oscillospiraceae bacterium]